MRGGWPKIPDGSGLETKRAALWSLLSESEERCKKLEKDLALNASMLAKQCDMAREAETKQMEAERKLQEIEHHFVVSINELARLRKAESDFQEVLIAVWRQFSVRSGHGRRTVYSAGGLYALDLVEAFLRKRKLLGSRGQVCDP